jgi:hypothetical protein
MRCRYVLCDTIGVMSSIDRATILRRIDELLGAQLPTDNEHNIYAAVVAEYQGTLGLIATLYGAASEQGQTMLNAAKKAHSSVGALYYNFPQQVRPVVKGTLLAMRADVAAGLIGSIGQRAAGEVLGDMLGLAKDAMSQGTEPAKNVAAVLTAAGL